MVGPEDREQGQQEKQIFFHSLTSDWVLTRVLWIWGLAASRVSRAGMRVPLGAVLGRVPFRGVQGTLAAVFSKHSESFL